MRANPFNEKIWVQNVHFFNAYEDNKRDINNFFFLIKKEKGTGEICADYRNE